jgi:hypothetical protein
MCKPVSPRTNEQSYSAQPKKPTLVTKVPKNHGPKRAIVSAQNENEIISIQSLHELLDAFDV